MTNENTDVQRECSVAFFAEAYTEAYHEMVLAKCEADALRYYGERVRDLLVTTYRLATARFYDAPSASIPTEWAKQLNGVAESMQELGIEV